MRNCQPDICKDKIGNCKIPGEDNLPVQCVGPWAEDKYFYLEKYLNSTREARRRFSEKGNAVFIDLFSGPEKCIIRDIQKEVLSGGMRALNREEAPFNEYFYIDISEANVNALKERIAKRSDCSVMCGDSNILAEETLLSILIQKPYRYHFAFIDPFGPHGLKFKTLRHLATLKRMDMMIHFPIGTIKRNLNTWKKNRNTILDDFLGTDEWRGRIQGKSGIDIYPVLIDTFKEQLKSIGYPEEGLRLISSDENIYSGLPAVRVKNTRDVDLYVLVLAAKHKLAQEIWHSVIRQDPGGQTTFLK